jgi:NAD(P)-dependent dehydrogenase (short-subunit alcohol dehydrogenase family)
MNVWGARIAIVTAAYSGLGRHVAMQLAQQGYDLVLANRDAARSGALANQLRAQFPHRRIEQIEVDLADHADMRRAAGIVCELVPHIDLLVHNAGLVMDGLHRSPQGNDLHFEVNTVAPYFLTVLLREPLANAPRASVVPARRRARRMDTANLAWPARFKRFAPYATTKLAGAAAMLSLARALAVDGTLVRIVDPGPSRTAMANNRGVPGWFRMFRPLFKTPAAAAARVVAAATMPDLAILSGVYLERGKVARLFAPLNDMGAQDTIAAMIERATTGLVPQDRGLA